MSRDNGGLFVRMGHSARLRRSGRPSTKPGESVRFNLVYFDAPQLPLTKTRMGGIYGVHLDRADRLGHAPARGEREKRRRNGI